jgi:uncharacterized protein (TIGR00251 family)
MLMISTIDGNLLVEIRVRPNSPKFRIEKSGGITIFCKSKPEGNRANLEIIRELEKLFKTEVKILKGFKSKKKTILIHGITAEEFNGMV